VNILRKFQGYAHGHHTSLQNGVDGQVALTRVGWRKTRDSFPVSGVGLDVLKTISAYKIAGKCPKCREIRHNGKLRATTVVLADTKVVFAAIFGLYSARKRQQLTNDVGRPE